MRGVLGHGGSCLLHRTVHTQMSYSICYFTKCRTNHVYFYWYWQSWWIRVSDDSAREHTCGTVYSLHWPKGGEMMDVTVIHLGKDSEIKNCLGLSLVEPNTIYSWGIWMWQPHAMKRVGLPIIYRSAAHNCQAHFATSFVYMVMAVVYKVPQPFCDISHYCFPLQSFPIFASF